MKAAIITTHAKERTKLRCSISPSELKTYLDHGIADVIGLQRGARYALRMFYSAEDDDYFIAVQSGGDGAVLTVMPLMYLDGRVVVTGAQKRSLRARTVRFLARGREASVSLVEEVAPVSPKKRAFVGYRIRVHAVMDGSLRIVTLGTRTERIHGEPSEWERLGPIHHWLRDRILELGIPFSAAREIHAGRKCSDEQVYDCLLQHLPLTELEIFACRHDAGNAHGDSGAIPQSPSATPPAHPCSTGC
jgi:hypothetical protein